MKKISYNMKLTIFAIVVVSLLYTHGLSGAPAISDACASAAAGAAASATAGATVIATAGAAVGATASAAASTATTVAKSAANTAGKVVSGVIDVVTGSESATSSSSSKCEVSRKISESKTAFQEWTQIQIIFEQVFGEWKKVSSTWSSSGDENAKKTILAATEAFKKVQDIYTRAHTKLLRSVSEMQASWSKASTHSEEETQAYNELQTSCSSVEKQFSAFSTAQASVQSLAASITSSSSSNAQTASATSTSSSTAQTSTGTAASSSDTTKSETFSASETLDLMKKWSDVQSKQRAAQNKWSEEWRTYNNSAKSTSDTETYQRCRQAWQQQCESYEKSFHTCKSSVTELAQSSTLTEAQNQIFAQLKTRFADAQKDFSDYLSQRAAWDASTSSAEQSSTTASSSRRCKECHKKQGNKKTGEKCHKCATHQKKTEKTSNSEGEKKTAQEESDQASQSSHSEEQQRSSSESSSESSSGSSASSLAATSASSASSCAATSGSQQSSQKGSSSSLATEITSASASAAASVSVSSQTVTA